MTNTYYEVIDTEISIEKVANKVIRREYECCYNIYWNG